MPRLRRNNAAIDLQNQTGARMAPIDIGIFEKELDSVEPLDDIWASAPPSPHEIIHSKHFLNRPNLYPSVQEDMEILFSGPNYAPICEVFLDDKGLGSGKSTEMAVCACIMLIRLFHLKNIETYFNLEKGIAQLALYNLAPTARVAADIVFRRYQVMLESMPWFKEHGIRINPNVTSRIEFMDKPVVIQPGNSSRAFGVGYDTFMCMIDECAADEGFETKDKDYFLDLFEAANERRRSRFVDTPEKGLMFCASSAGTENRAFEKMITEIEEKYEDDSTLNPKTDPIDHEMGKVLIRRQSAFIANPKHKKLIDMGEYFEHTVVREPRINKKITYTVKIPNTFKRRFDLNPAKLLRNMCAIPSMAISNFFTDWDKVLNCVRSSNRVDPYPNKVDEYGYLTEVSPPEVWRDLPDNFHGINGLLYYLHCDLAISGDGCGLAFGHRMPNIIYEGMALPKVGIDLSICFQGSLQKKIQIAEVKQFIIDLHVKRGFQFAKITFDGFQSVQTMQELENSGYIVEKSGIKKSAFEVLMELLYDNRLDWYEDDWALGEAKRLEDKGNVVEKSLGSTDDEIECVAKVAEESVIGELPKNMPSQRALGFASKGIIKTRKGAARPSAASDVGKLNPQADKQFIKPAYGFSSRGFGRRK